MTMTLPAVEYARQVSARQQQQGSTSFDRSRQGLHELSFLTQSCQTLDSHRMASPVGRDSPMKCRVQRMHFIQPLLASPKPRFAGFHCAFGQGQRVLGKAHITRSARFYSTASCFALSSAAV